MTPRTLAAAFLFLAGACRSCDEAAAPDAGAPGPAEARGRIIVLGFDGVDPRFLERWAEESKLPALQRLMKAHGGRAYRPLGSTNPPQSPVAWTSFATGTRPGEHGIFDFVGRRLTDGEGPPVLPFVATTSFEPQEVGPPVARNLRTGEPFWKTLADDGVRTIALNVPYSFPPDPMREGRMLSGLGVPDLRETNSTFLYAGTDVEQARAVAGGQLVPVVMEGEAGMFEVDGPSIPGTRNRMKLRVEVRRAGEEGALVLRIGETAVNLAPRRYSDFVELTFRERERQVRGIARFVALGATPEIRLFMTPMSFHPRAPYSPITYPGGYAAQIADALGTLYKTVGWDHDTSALNEEVIDDELFLSDMDAVENDRRRMLMSALAGDDWELLIWVSTAIDRVSHMFYRLIDPEHPRYDAELAGRHGDAIEREYRRMDETVAQVLPRLRPDDTLLILSDHGFHNFRRGLHVNQWLRQQGLLVLRGDAESTTQDFLLGVDWTRTKAYALGTGQVYLNLRGRERDGTVSREQAAEVLAQIRDGLTALRDEERGGARVIDRVYLGSEVFQGGRASDAPDLQMAFAEHYRTSWETILGGVPAGLFAYNTRKWSGDHSASDVEDTPGILVANRPLREDVEIVDIAPTVLSFFGRERPARYVGTPVLAENP